MGTHARRGWVAGVLTLVVSAGAWGQEEAPIEGGMREVFPHVRVDAAAKVVEFDGIVPIDCHQEETPEVFLEVVACTPGTKEHEALVMTKARASHVHAALLSIGLEPGKPGSWNWDGEKMTSVEPEGPAVGVRISYERDGERVEADARDWIVKAEGGGHFGEGATWVFAGSRFVTRDEREVYDADGTGLVIGLTTFGSEVVAWHEVISPESDVQEPAWIANRELVPAYKTEVVVRLSAK